MTFWPSRNLSAPSTTILSPTFEPGSDGDAFALDGAERDGRDFGGAVGLHDVDKRALLAALDRGGRQGDDVVHGVDPHADVDELIGEQRFVVVWEIRRAT